LGNKKGSLHTNIKTQKDGNFVNMSIISSQLLSFNVVTHQPRYRIWTCFGLKLVGGGKSHDKNFVAIWTRPAKHASI